MTKIIYNRVSKAGSTTMTALILALSELNNFTFIGDTHYFPANTTLHAKILSNPDNSVYINHCNYVDNLPDDYIWINMVREPLERAESEFYYEVSSTRGNNAKHDLRVREHDNLCGCPYDEFDACYRKRYANNKCKDRLVLDSLESMYFSEASEHGARTLNSSTILFYQSLPGWTAEMAYKRIREKYLFVGLTEEIVLSVKMFEHLLPHFFRNASAVFASMSKKTHSNRTPEVNRVTNTTMGGAITTFVRELLTEHNAAEMELYEKVKRLFWGKVAHILPNEVDFDGR